MSPRKIQRPSGKLCWLRRGGGRFAIAALLFAAFTSGNSAAAPDFAQEVRPILEKRCGTCHGRLQQKGGLRLDAGKKVLQGGKHGAILEPGRAQDSRLLARVTSTNAEERMPPEGSPLDPAQIAVLTAWINSGAPIPPNEIIPPGPAEHWAFQPIQHPPPPPVQNGSWPRNPLDMAADKVAEGLMEAVVGKWDRRGRGSEARRI